MTLEPFNADPLNVEASSASTAALWLGAGLITAGFLANTLQGALGKIALEVIAPGQFLWLLLLIALAVVIPVAWWQRRREISGQEISGQEISEPEISGETKLAGWNKQVLPFYFLRAVFGLCGFYLFVWAAGLGSLVDATVLLNTTPVFIPVIGVVALNKEISLKLWGAISLGFLGLLLVVQPNAGLLRNPANLLGLGAGLSAAIEFLTVRSLSKTQTPLAQTFYYLLIGTLLMSPIALWQWQSLTLDTLEIAAAAAGLFLTFQLLLVKAYSLAEPHQIGIFQYSSVIFAAIIGWLFFDEIPNAIALTGMVLIVVGGALSIYWEQDLDPSSANSGSVT